MTESIAAPRPRPGGVTAIALLFSFGVLASGLSALSLLDPRGPLAVIWRMKPEAQAALLRMGPWAVALMTAVCLACIVAAVGFFRGTRWGYRLGVGVLLANLCGDVINSLIGTEPGAWVGVPIVAGVLWYLSTPSVTRFFGVTRIGSRQR